MFIKQTPLILKILPFYIIGIILSFYANYNFNSTRTILLIIGLMPILVYAGKKEYTKNILFGYIISLVFLGIGLINGSVHQSNFTDSNKQNNASQYFVKISETPVIKKKSIKIIGNYYPKNEPSIIKKAIFYLRTDSLALTLKENDNLIINSKLAKIPDNKNPDSFDYKRYLKINNINHQTFIDSKNWLKIGHNKSKLNFIMELRSYLIKKVDDLNLNNENKAIAKALLIGQKQFLDNETLRTFSSAGAMHVLAVSGLHVGIIMMILKFILIRLKRFKYGTALYLSLMIMGLWSFALITGASPSVLRASLMFSFIVLGQTLQRDASVYQSILISAFIILLIDPFSLFKVGFQLSYLAVIGIIYWQPKIYKLIYLPNKILDYAWKISSVSIAAQLATFPLGLYYFHQFPVLFFVSNLFVIPLAGILLSTGFLYFILGSFTSYALILAKPLSLLFTALNSGVKIVDSIPYSIIWGISITWYEALILLTTIVVLAIFIELKNIKFLYLVSGLIICFFSLQLYDKTKVNKSNQLVIYHTKKDIGIDIFNGSKNNFLASENLVNQKDKLLFNVQHHWFKMSGNETANNTMLLNDSTNYLISFKSETIALLNQRKTSHPICSIVILRNIKNLSDSYINKLKMNESKIIMHPDLTYYLKYKLYDIYPEHLLYSIEEKGAFILD